MTRNSFVDHTIYMNPEAEELLKKILAKDLNDLTDGDKGFLRARRSYLTKEQENTYRNILKQKDEPIEPPVEIVAEPAPFVEQPVEEVVGYSQLLTQAKELGYSGPRISRARLEAFIAEHK